MAEAKRAGRTSVARMKPAQTSREQKIATMIISGGMSNDEIYAAFEAQDESLIRAEDGRRQAGLVKTPFDTEERAKLARAVRSVRGLAQKAAGDNAELVEILGAGETRPASQVDYENLKRFSSGDKEMDWIHGQTRYVWLLPMAMRKVINPATKKPFDYGDLVPRKYHKFVNPTNGLIEEREINAPGLPEDFAFGDPTGYVEEGLPSSFVSVWGGARGTGKSRLAIELEKSTCAAHEHRSIVHNYGESDIGQLRQWIGPKAPENLIIGERRTLSSVISDIYKYKPILYVVDSLQTIIETGTSRGLKEVLATFKAIANEDAAGKPHIAVLSMLNQKGNLKGNSDIGHIADMVAKVVRHETRKSVFKFETDKNRGGETPRGATYQHTETGVVCLGSGTKNRPTLNLIQANQPVLAGGIVDHAALPEDGGEDIV